jgi:hypothetical protein
MITMAFTINGSTVHMDHLDPALSRYYLDREDDSLSLIEIPVQDLPDGSPIFDEYGDPKGTYLGHS